ncbi:MAG: hypothetical protein JRJ60_17750 [Deltaproteobacteria bacterium]|nr:hypothetical protein [Deltaproteobacteria bacterium]
MNRIQHDIVKKDLARKMVFLTGPRQVGKTYLARHCRVKSTIDLYYQLCFD